MEDESSTRKKILLSDDKGDDEEEFEDDVEAMNVDTTLDGDTRASNQDVNQDMDGTVDDLFGDSTPSITNIVPSSLPTPDAAMTQMSTPSANDNYNSKTLLHDLFSPAFQNNPFLSSCSDRFRSALARVRTSPTTDIEAWQALLTEAQISFRLVHASSDDDPDKYPKLDFIEACYGALLLHFPYSSLHLVQILEILYTISALPAEEGGNLMAYGYQDVQLTPRQIRAEAKMEYIFQDALGIQDDILTDFTESNEEAQQQQSPSLSPCTQGMNMSSVDLWLIYIKKRTRDATRKAYPPSNAMMPSPPISNPVKYLRDAVTDAYKKTLSIAHSIPNCHLLWRRYLTHVRSWSLTITSEDPNNPNIPTTTTDPTLANEQMLLLRKIYQTVISTPMPNLEDYWREYEQFERNLSDVLAQVLLTEHLPSYQHARGVYLERVRYINATSSTNQPSTTAAAQRQRWAATPPEVDDTEEMAAEAQMLAKFRARCAYERTNPERKAGMNKEMVRQVHKEMICAFMRHPEVWHEWAMWELLTTEDVSAAPIAVKSNSADGSDSNDPSSAANKQKKSNIVHCVQVFELARKHIPDCALLTISQAEVMEIHGKNPKGAMKILQHFVSHILPCALGYVTLQKMVRRYDGVDACRKVFSRARRYLNEDVEDLMEATDGENANPATGTVGPTPSDPNSSAIVSSLTKKQSTMVKSRKSNDSSKIKNGLSTKHQSTANNSTSKNTSNKKPIKRGVMTWHIYACHATIEHRINALPRVAARIYELGLRKHRSFLATPAYVLQYADLLWELNETENLRALLSRSIAACDENKTMSASLSSFSTSCPTRPLWDALLKLECTKSNCLERIRKVEANRRKALFDHLDLDFTADLFSQSGNEYSGFTSQDAQSHKTLMETLIRQDGYENASIIGNGLGRMLDRFELVGAFGDGVASSHYSHTTSSNLLHDAAAAGGGGPSDISFAKRMHHLHTQHHLINTLSSNTNVIGGGASNAAAASGLAAGGTLLDRSRAARERMQLQQQQNQQQQQSALMAKMNSPEWLRPLISMLPPPARFQRGGIPMMQKPPPHLVEMALAFLKSTPLPERPTGDSSGPGKGLNGNKRKRNYDYSSDEEGGNPSQYVTGGNGGAGYANQFRIRQRARLMQSHQPQAEGENGGDGQQ